MVIRLICLSPKYEMNIQYNLKHIFEMNNNMTHDD